MRLISIDLMWIPVERTMKQIAEELNGGILRSEQWHKQLLVENVAAALASFCAWPKRTAAAG
jgi:hypothetical protein